MKPHAAQRARDAERAEQLRVKGVTRLTAPSANFVEMVPGSYGVCLALRGPTGEQHCFQMMVDPYEVREFGLGPQDPHRELRPDWQKREMDIADQRRRFIEYLSGKIAAAMFEHLETNDPQFGYSAKEWKQP